MSDAPALEAQESTYCVFTWHNALISVWRSTPTVEHLEVLLKHERRLDKRAAHGFGVFSVVAEAPTKFLQLSDASRTKAREISLEMDAHTLLLANIVLGSGFWGSTVRSVMAGATIVNRPKYPTKTFDGAQEAARWAAPLLSARGAPGVTGEALAQALAAAIDTKNA